MRVFLKTQRLLLRRFTHSDVANLQDLDGDPEVMRFVNGGRAVSRDVIRDETMPRFLRAYERFEGFGVFAAIERSTGEFVGWFEFYPLKEETGPEEVELGYRLRRSAWGKGYATEGSRALIRKGFTELGVRRVVAETLAVHAASRRVMEKAGLMYVRTFRQEWPDRIEGDEHGDVEYALTKADWERQEPVRSTPDD
jgi:RimJ/RimL family protein N-acetyltransferase